MAVPLLSTFLCLAGLARPALAESPEATGERPPNIVLIVADDLGYADLGFQGGTDIPTPNIDRLATEGVRFTQAYVSCPVCAPTRAGLATGRYQQRFGFETNPGPEDRASEGFGLPVTETTIAERLRERGYATGMVGKWHLGYQDDLRPTARGFDEFFGFLSGGNPYIDRGGARESHILRGNEPVDEAEYLTDAFRREAVAFVDAHAGAPFFLYLTPNAVHTPLQADEARLAKFAGIRDSKRRTYAAMLSALDDLVGAVLAKIDEKSLAEETLVFFISDNGGPTQNSSRNDPLRGTKGTMFDGGIHVPLVARWTGRLARGATYERPVISLDIHPTVLAATATEVPPDTQFDGVNLLPYLAGENEDSPHQELFWRMGESHAARVGDWKIVTQREGRTFLFDLASDPGEMNDLAEREPERLAALQERYESWARQMAEPRWGRNEKRRGR